MLNYRAPMNFGMSPDAQSPLNLGQNGVGNQMMPFGQRQGYGMHPAMNPQPPPNQAMSQALPMFAQMYAGRPMPGPPMGAGAMQPAPQGMGQLGQALMQGRWGGGLGGDVSRFLMPQVK